MTLLRNNTKQYNIVGLKCYRNKSNLIQAIGFLLCAHMHMHANARAHAHAHTLVLGIHMGEGTQNQAVIPY